MNVFRLCGDMSHLLAIVILLVKIWQTRSCSGISGKTQVLFALVFVTRYLDLFVNFISIYNTAMKIIYIVLSIVTCYLIFVKFKTSYEDKHDAMRAEFLVVLASVLAYYINDNPGDVLEILWTFSIYLESVAILPQFLMIIKTGECETITSHYLFAQGSYRALYIANWVYRYNYEGHLDLISIYAGSVQTIFYCAFFTYWYGCSAHGNPMKYEKGAVVDV